MRAAMPMHEDQPYQLVARLIQSRRTTGGFHMTAKYGLNRSPTRQGRLPFAEGRADEGEDRVKAQAV